jgi:hypothetical protein
VLGSELVASPRLAQCRSEVVEIRSSRDGKTGEIRKKRRVRSLAARASGKARDVQDRRRRVLVDREVLAGEPGNSGELVTG